MILAHAEAGVGSHPPTADIRTVYPIEEAFKRKMFEDADEGA
jgi:hypothetical protein